MTELTHRVECADALAFLRSLPDASVGLVLTDPPYFRVKPHGWDRAWSAATGFLDWLDTIAAEWARVLKPNGTLVCFAGCNPAVAPGASLAARVECKLAERFNVIASAVWVKQHGAHSGMERAALRAFAPQTERVIICEHYDSDSAAAAGAGYDAACAGLRASVFEPLRAYLASEWQRAGLTPADADEATQTHMAGHWFTSSQWALPTRKHYETLQARANRDTDGHLRREYEDLRREYEDLRREYEDLRRPFNAEAGAFFADAWAYAPVAPGPPGEGRRHPCAKPRDMAEDLVRQCSRRGDVVLDTFAGSGVFLAAAARLGRIAWGCDADPQWAQATEVAVTGETPEDGGAATVPQLVLL